MTSDTNSWNLPPHRIASMALPEGATYTFVQPPKPIGYWTIDPKSPYGSTYFAIHVKPTDQQIKNTEEMFGWKWKDNE